MVAEVALALVVMAAAGSTIQSLQRVRGVDPGFEPDGLLVLHFELPEGSHPAGAGRIAALSELRNRVTEA